MQNPRIENDLANLGITALSGDADLSLENIFNFIISNLFAETATLFALLRHMLIIAILSALFKAMTTNFKNTSISKLGFYVCYIMVITLLFRTFTMALGIMTDMVDGITNLLMGATPIIIGLVASGGYVASAGAFAPILIFASSFLTFLINTAMIPILISTSAISLVSYLSEKEGLDKLSKLMQKGISFGLKSIAVVFISILSFQRVATPILNNIAIRGTRTVVSAVPVVGQALSGAIDTAMFYGQALRGAASAALLAAAVAISIIPILQMAAFVVTYKITAALIAPICDERLVNAVDTTGSYAALALGVCVMAAALFIFIVLITLSV